MFHRLQRADDDLRDRDERMKELEDQLNRLQARERQGGREEAGLGQQVGCMAHAFRHGALSFVFLSMEYGGFRAAWGHLGQCRIRANLIIMSSCPC